MRLYEFLDTKVALQPAHDHESGLYGYLFIVDNREYFVGFKESGDNEYYMSFTGTDDNGKHSAKLLGHNKPYKIFGGVTNAILQFIKTHDPDMIEFCVESDELKRGYLYDKLLDFVEKNGKLPPEYTWDRDGNHNYWIFKKGHR